MRAALAIAFLSALAAACAPGMDPQFTIDGSIQTPIGGGSIGPDGGTDGGDAGHDAGTDAGSGCDGGFFQTGFVTDYCVQGGAAGASVTIDPTNCSAHVVVFDSVTLDCTGTASTSANSFDGGCTGLSTSCTSASLPGTIVCQIAGGLCSIQICSADGGSCPP
jgi:hypothetical protein